MPNSTTSRAGWQCGRWARGGKQTQTRIETVPLLQTDCAEDIKHERKVALEVLKPELAAVVGAERFLAEIKTTANHGVGLAESTTDVTNP